MIAVRAPSRTIQEIPALLVMTLNDGGKLPLIPNEPRPGGLGFRRPDLRDMQSLRWLACWEGARVDKDGFRKVCGLAAFRDTYDWHTASDVRELCAIRGSRRAVVDLTRWLLADASEQARRLVGVIERKDCGLQQLVARLGCRPVWRDIWEAAPCHS